jgi:hypothetical protein
MQFYLEQPTEWFKANKAFLTLTGKPKSYW